MVLKNVFVPSSMLDHLVLSVHQAIHDRQMAHVSNVIVQVKVEVVIQKWEVVSTVLVTLWVCALVSYFLLSLA